MSPPGDADELKLKTTGLNKLENQKRTGKARSLLKKKKTKKKNKVEVRTKEANIRAQGSRSRRVGVQGRDSQERKAQIGKPLQQQSVTGNAPWMPT